MLTVQPPKWVLRWSYMGHTAQSICLEQGPHYSNVWWDIPFPQILGKLHIPQYSAEGENSFQSLLTSFLSEFWRGICFVWKRISSCLIDKVHLVRLFILLWPSGIPPPNRRPKLVNRLYLKTQCWPLKSLSLKLGSPSSISSPMDSYFRRLRILGWQK